MNTDVKPKRSTQRRYSPELKERAVRMVLQLREETGEKHGSVKRVADQLDIGIESLRSWVRQAEIDRGDRGGTTSEDAARINALEQENRELRRANEILQRAASFFGAELDRRQK
jgi:transposase-like protein